MDDWILKFTDTTVEPGSEIVGRAVEFHGGIGLGWIVLMAVAFAAVIWVSYKWMPSEQTGFRRFTLIALRGAFVVLLLGILFRPILALEISQKIRQTFLVLIDSSSSMAIKDPRVGELDMKRAAIAEGRMANAKGNLPDGYSAELANQFRARTNVLQSVFSNEDLNLLPQLADKFDLVAFTFGRGGQVRELPRVAQEKSSATNANPAKLTVKDFNWIDSLGAEHSATAVGDSMLEILKRKRGQPLAGVLVITDGAHNTGVQPLTVAQEMGQTGVPVYFYGVGITSPRDIIITEMDAPSAAFVEDELLVKVRVRSRGFGNQAQSANLVLTLNGEKVTEEQIQLGEDGEQIVPLRFPTETAGEFKLEAAIEPMEEETDPTNNSASRQLRIVDEKIKVLFVEELPRWDYKYLQAVLMRDRRVEVKTLLLNSDPKLAQQDDTPYIDKFPENKKDLFEYDVIVFGDVDPGKLRQLNSNAMDNLNEFVSRFGGAFVMIAGRGHSPVGYGNTGISDMLPVEFTPRTTVPVANEPSFTKAIRVELTALGKIDPMLNLASEEEDNESMWADLPPIFWTAPVTRKPGAEVLMIDPAVDTERGKRPVIARHQYGLGQVLFVGTDNTWRWRRNVGDLYYTRFWGQVSQRMAQQRFIGADKRTQISLNAQNYMAGEDRVKVYARLYQEGYEPFDETEVTGVIETVDAAGAPKQYKVTLKMVGGSAENQKESQRGLYYAEFPAPDAGQYKFFVEAAPDTKRDFTVTATSLELAETAMNAPLMQELAAVSASKFAGEKTTEKIPGHTDAAGQHHPWFFREEDLSKLPEAVVSTPVDVRSKLEIELWAHPLYFILILLVVTIEWVVRKFSYLK